MTQRLTKFITRLVAGGETDLGELYKLCLDQTSSWKPRPEPAEIEKVIQEAVDKHEKAHKLGIELVKNWVNECAGEFSLSLAYKELEVAGRPQLEAIVRQCFHRLVERGIIVPASRKRGVYRRVEATSEPLNFLDAPGKPLDIYLPMDIHDLVYVYPGNIIVVAGEQDVGKSCFCLDLIKHNMNKYVINYVSSEMAALELKNRLEKHEDITPQEWNFKAWSKSRDFADGIVPNEINIIDYLEVDMDKPYLITNEIRAIHDRLHQKDGGGIAILAIQKSPGKEFGVGGAGTAEKPRLYITMERTFDKQGGIVKILKGKNWKNGANNPNGKIRHYYVIGGWKIITNDDWHLPTANEKPKRLF